MSEILEPIGEILEDVVAGEVSKMTMLLSVPHEELFNASAGRNLVVSVDSLKRVLTDSLESNIDLARLKCWSSLMMRGYIAGGRGRIEPINIRFDPAYEDDISEIISRLDEIHDPLDGEISPEELRNLLTRVNQW